MRNLQKPGLKEPSVYLIRIQGTLDESWGDYFGGESTPSQDDEQNPLTTLRTPLIDQSELVGLVNRLNGLGLRLLSVESVLAECDQPFIDPKTISTNHKE
jgi:hypothetical protein